MTKIHYALTHLDVILNGLSRGLEMTIIDKGFGEQFGTKQLHVPFVSGTSELDGAKERASAGSRVLELQDEPAVSLFGLQVAPRFTAADSLASYLLKSDRRSRGS